MHQGANMDLSVFATIGFTAAATAVVLILYFIASRKK
jgi:hypothetical protein